MLPSVRLNSLKMRQQERGHEELGGPAPRSPRGSPKGSAHGGVVEACSGTNSGAAKLDDGGDNGVKELDYGANRGATELR